MPLEYRPQCIVNMINWAVTCYVRIEFGRTSNDRLESALYHTPQLFASSELVDTFKTVLTMPIKRAMKRNLKKIRKVRH